MSKFNPGDQVIIVDAQRGISYMQKLIGRVTTITRVGANAEDKKEYYNIQEDEGCFLWCEEWLELYSETCEGWEDLLYEKIY